MTLSVSKAESTSKCHLFRTQKDCTLTVSTQTRVYSIHYFFGARHRANKWPFKQSGFVIYIQSRLVKSRITIVLHVQSYHGELYPRRFGHHSELYLDSPGHRLQSQMEKSKIRIKNEVPSVLPDSAQGPPEASNPIPHSFGLELGPLPYLCS